MIGFFAPASRGRVGRAAASLHRKQRAVVVHPTVGLADSYAAVVFTAVNIILVGSAWVLARRLFPGDDILTVMRNALVMAWSVIAVVGVALGATGLLYASALEAAVAAGACGLMIIAARARPRGGEPPQARTLAERAWILAWSLVFGYWGVRVVNGGLLTFPTDFDSLMYHIPMIDFWIQAHSLFTPDFSRWSNPGSNELIGLWLAAPFSGDFLVAAENLVATVLLACSAVDLARHLGASTGLSHIGGFAVVSNWMIFKQLTDSENDVAVAALFLTCLCFAFRYSRGQRLADLVLGGLALGLLASVKFYALGYAAAALACFALLGLALLPYRRTLTGVTAWLAISLIVGGYWYVRNTAVGGSPVYPKAIAGADDLMLRIYPALRRSSFLHSGRPEVLPMAAKAVWNLGGPCTLAAFAGAPAAVAWSLMMAAFTFGRGGRKGRRIAAARIALATLLTGTAVLSAVTPLTVEDQPDTLNQLTWGFTPFRYGLSFLSLSVLALAVVATDISAGFRSATVGCGRVVRAAAYVPHAVFAVVVLAQASSYYLVADRGEIKYMLYVISLILFIINIYYIVKIWPQLRVPLALVFMLILVAGSWFAAAGLARRWHRGYAAFYDRYFNTGVFKQFEQTDILGRRPCVLFYRPYPFLGSRRQVHFCNLIFISSCDSFYEYLRTNGVTTVSVEPFENPSSTDLSRYQYVKAWLRADPARFVPLTLPGSRVEVFRFTDGQGTGGAAAQ